MDVATTGLLALFVIAVVPLIPTEVALLGMGVAAAHGEAGLVPVIAVAAVGCFLSDQALYLAARRGGMPLVERARKRKAADNALRWITEHAENHLRAILIISRWLPSGGTVGALLAGALRWPRGPFLSASAVGVVLWSTYVALLGYFGGQFVQQPGMSMLISLAVALVIGSVFGAVVRRQVSHTEA